jgi:hypothetical protein
MRQGQSGNQQALDNLVLIIDGVYPHDEYCCRIVSGCPEVEGYKEKLGH